MSRRVSAILCTVTSFSVVQHGFDRLTNQFQRSAKNLPGEVFVATVRDPDGLAMSSRNVYLTPEQRAVAPALYAALSAVTDALRTGEGALGLGVVSGYGYL